MSASSGVAKESQVNPGRTWSDASNSREYDATASLMVQDRIKDKGSQNDDTYRHLAKPDARKVRSCRRCFSFSARGSHENPSYDPQNRCGMSQTAMIKRLVNVHTQVVCANARMPVHNVQL